METHLPRTGPIARDFDGPVESRQPRLDTASEGARLLLIGAALTAVIAAYAYVGGWLAHNELKRDVPNSTSFWNSNVAILASCAQTVPFRAVHSGKWVV
jgi:hypothetical protein